MYGQGQVTALCYLIENHPELLFTSEFRNMLSREFNQISEPSDVMKVLSVCLFSEWAEKDIEVQHWMVEETAKYWRKNHIMELPGKHFFQAIDPEVQAFRISLFRLLY